MTLISSSISRYIAVLGKDTSSRNVNSPLWDVANEDTSSGSDAVDRLVTDVAIEYKLEASVCDASRL